MLTEYQVQQFNIFGFVILKNILANAEIKTLQSEFKYASDRNETEVGSFDGKQAHTFSMLGMDTPFYSSLLEDPRFHEPAVELFGSDVFGLETNSYRYVTNTNWHFNDGSPNIHGYGAKYQFPIFDPVKADTGALRFIPGSHKNPYQSELANWWPLATESSKSEKGMVYMDKIPHCVAECDPGDAVLFDTRIFHCTWGGSIDRRMSCVTYYHYPKTNEEFEVMHPIAKGFYHNPKRWNKTQWENWFSNPKKSQIRQVWIKSWENLASIQK